MLKCLGHVCRCPGEPDDYDCGYAHADFGCEDCIITGGRFSPQTGKPFRGDRAKYIERAKTHAQQLKERNQVSLDDSILAASV